MTAFSLLFDLATGQEQTVIDYLDWAAGQGVNGVRVFSTAVHLFDLSPEAGRQQVPRLLELAARRGLYVEVVGLADTKARVFDHATHLAALSGIIADSPWNLLEIANEPAHPTQDARLADAGYLAALRGRVSSTVRVAFGAAHGEDDESLAYVGGEYVTVHTSRREGEEGWRWVRHTREMQALRDNGHHKDAINDEPDRKVPYADQHRALGWLCRIFALGDTFHYGGGRYGHIPEGAELEAFTHRRAGWFDVSAGWRGTYSRAKLAGDPVVDVDDRQVLRIYSSLNGNVGYQVGLNVKSEASIRWGNGWHVESRIAVGNARLWRVVR
jgi:hypothetical protein